MCVAQTAKRRRRQIKIDPRYKSKDIMAATRRAERRLAEERARVARKASKK